MGMFLVALLFLRELSPEIRDQLMVSAKERTLVEIQARGIDPKEATAHPWRQMLSWDLIGSSFAISVFLLIYFAAVGFFTIYFTTTFTTAPASTSPRPRPTASTPGSGASTASCSSWSACSRTASGSASPS